MCRIRHPYPIRHLFSMKKFILKQRPQDTPEMRGAREGREEADQGQLEVEIKKTLGGRGATLPGRAQG